MLTYRRRGEGSVEVDRALELDTSLTSKILYFLIFEQIIPLPFFSPTNQLNIKKEAVPP